MTWILLICCTVTFTLLVLACIRIEELQSEVREEAQIREDEGRADHAKCIAHVAHVVSHRFLADAYRRLAEEWDSPVGRHQIRVLVRDVSDPDGPSVPARWMLQQADALDASVEGTA